LDFDPKALSRPGAPAALGEKNRPTGRLWPILKEPFILVPAKISAREEVAGFGERALAYA
jgi:hypothetical protein